MNTPLTFEGYELFCVGRATNIKASRAEFVATDECAWADLDDAKKQGFQAIAAYVNEHISQLTTGNDGMD